MNKYISVKPALFVFQALLLLLAACNKPVPQADSAPAATTAAAQAAPVACVDEPQISYLCGVINGEDILHLGDTPWLLVSGMNGDLANNPAINGKLHLVNPAERKFSILFPGDKPVLELNSELYKSCPGPLDVAKFSVHGIALKAIDNSPGHYRLYSTSHGTREAVEVYEIDAAAAPAIKWIGCIPMPATSWTNSLVILKDWGFLATQFMDPTGSGMDGVTRKEITGQVFEWHPGSEVSRIKGTELSGPNGIVMSDDERYIYVAAFGTNQVVRFDRSTTPPAKEIIAVTIAPDNLRWTSAGTIYAAGGNITDTCGGPVCGTGWSVFEINPATLSAKRIAGADEKVALKGVSSAQEVGKEIWVGTYGGDRLGILPKP